LGPRRLLNHAKPLSDDAVAALRDGTNSPMRTGASRHNRARHLWGSSGGDGVTYAITNRGNVKLDNRANRCAILNATDVFAGRGGHYAPARWSPQKPML
jgi:hypothetical protein